jgi:hypothetical protein
MDFDFVSFKAKLKETARKFYLDYIEDNNITDLCGFALYVYDPRLIIKHEIYVAMGVNTLKHLHITEEEYDSCETDKKFNPRSWEYYPSHDSKYMDAFTTMIETKIEKATPETTKEQYIKFKKELCTILVDILEELKEEKLFDRWTCDFILLFRSCDYYYCEPLFDPEYEINIMERLNSEKTAYKFSEWIKNIYETRKVQKEHIAKDQKS